MWLEICFRIRVSPVSSQSFRASSSFLPEDFVAPVLSCVKGVFLLPIGGIDRKAVRRLASLASKARRIGSSTYLKRFF